MFKISHLFPGDLTDQGGRDRQKLGDKLEEKDHTGKTKYIYFVNKTWKKCNGNKCDFTGKQFANQFCFFNLGSYDRALFKDLPENSYC